MSVLRDYPIPMIIHCPVCCTQHIDKVTAEWANPPHRSHQCASCGTVFRTADVPTVGVEKIRSRGDGDTWP